MLRERFPGGDLRPVLLVYRRAGGLTSSDRARIVADARRAEHVPLATAALVPVGPGASPGQVSTDIERMLRDALGDLAERVEITPFDENESTSSPADTPLWDALGRVSSQPVEGSSLVPFLTVGATDARFFRRKGSTAYGYGLFSRHLSFEDYASMFHGNDERVDIESLVLSTKLWDALARDLLDN